MCYSFKTSLVSYSLGMLSCIFAFCTRQYILGTLILFFCQMQLSEALIWKGIDDNNISLNKFGTKYGQYLLPSHVFAVGAGYILTLIILKKTKISFPVFIPALIGLLFYLTIILGPYRNEKYSDVTYPTDKECADRSCQNNKNRLKWPYPHTWYFYGFVICIAFIIIYVQPVKSKIFLGTIFIISLVASMIAYPKNVGSVWCFAAAVLSPVLVLGNYILIRNTSDLTT